MCKSHENHTQDCVEVTIVANLNHKMVSYVCVIHNTLNAGLVGRKYLRMW